jgi:hypothetical protein
VKKSIVAVALVVAACGSRSIPEDDSVVAACPACAPASFSCAASNAGQGSTAMTIAAGDADSCIANFGHAALELRCRDSLVCEGDSCVPFQFDGTTLSFRYGVAPVSCGVDRR